MFGNIIGIAILLAVAIGLALLVRLAWRTKKPLIRWPVAILGGFFTLIAFIATCFAINGLFKAYPKVGRPVQTMEVDRSPERVARGEHIANAWCASCHTVNGKLPLTGGHNLADEIHMPMGNLTPYNLTPGGPLKDMTDGEVFRAIREGAHKDGTKLFVMSAQHVRYLSDDDLKSVIAYLRSQPAVANVVPLEYLNVLGLVLVGANMVPNIPEAPPVTVSAPPKGATAEYGEYVVKWTGCRECHGPTLSGSLGGLLPPGPSLRVTKDWTTEQFLQTMRTGVDPFGKKLDSLMMPWTFVQRLDDDEQRAIHLYLQKVDIPLIKQ